ncbi:E3 ubiquitin-protein ligase RNF14-like [Triticum aestivum]|uniref:E3 ubiquitin-protein ligase RNF14-like n=1 Tax=Triticum aestivum TaxID=4565 RepID=UPI001D0156B6|nr:E3 ubiquitin-protein ligase RNF14-like [Triticum aestivum]
MAASSAGTSSSSRAILSHRIPDPGFSTEASSSSPSARADGSDEDMLNLDFPWVAAAEAESILEDAAATERIHLRAAEEDEEGIRVNQERQQDELMALEAIYGDDLVEFKSKGGLRFFQSYPRKDPPYFTVTAKWMDGSQVCQICEMLDDIWAQLPGQEVVYQWVEWTRSSSLSHLWIDGKIILGPGSPAHKSDNRAISRGLPLNYVIPSMLSYSSKKRRKAFLDDLHMCLICLTESNGSNFIQLPCQHLFCATCMETFCRIHVKEGTVFQLVCPGTKCNASIPPYLLKNLLREEEFERWDRLLLDKALGSMSDVVYCPRCSMACLADEDKNAQCQSCFFTFCSACKDPRHLGRQCLTPEQKLKASGKLTVREMVQEMLMIRSLYNDARACPNCRMVISRSEGCNMMYCVNCGKSFCFRCGEAMTASNYNHFSKCGLFAPQKNDYNTNDLEKRLKELETAERVAQMHPLGSTIECPKCRQKIFKVRRPVLFNLQHGMNLQGMTNF